MADAETQQDEAPKAQPGESAAEDVREQTEARFGANLRVVRERVGISQTRLAEEMAARGWPWRQPTVSSVESGQRMVRLGEAKTAADILETSLDRLTEPTAEVREVELLSEWIRQAREAWRQIADATTALLNARGLLRIHPAVASGTPPGSPRVAEAVRRAQDVQGLTPEGAVARGIAEKARNTDFFAERARLEGSAVIRPQAWNDAQAIAAALREGEIVVVDFSETPVSELGRLQDFISGAVTVRGGQVHLLQKASPDAEHPNQARYRLTPAMLTAYEENMSGRAPEASAGNEGTAHLPGEGG